MKSIIFALVLLLGSPVYATINPKQEEQAEAFCAANFTACLPPLPPLPLPNL